MAAMRCVSPMRLLLLYVLLHETASLSGLLLDDLDEGFKYGEVMELTDATIEAALNKYDHVLVDFYAPWCQHCRSLAPELAKAAPMLADVVPPILVAKVDADKYKSLVEKYDISFFPTLKFFTNGYATDYDGPHGADTLVSRVRRLAFPAIETFSSESDFRDFLKSHTPELPLFVGFGLDASTLGTLAQKYRSKAWFAVLSEFSENAVSDFGFERGPALVVFRGADEVQDIFYGPFEGMALPNFIKQNLVPLVIPLTIDSLKLLKEDGRPHVVAVLETETTPEAKAFIEKMKGAALANRAFVFSHVVASQWPKFVRPFNLGKKPVLPTVLIWEGQTYSKSDKTEAFVGESMEAELSRLLQDYKENKVKREKVKAPTLYEKATENYVNASQYFALLIVIAVTVWRKNGERRASLLNEEREGRPLTRGGPDREFTDTDSSEASKDD